MISTLSIERKTAIAFVIVAIILLMAPNIVWSLNEHTPSALVEGLLIPSVLILAFFAILGRSIWLACLVLVPFTALSPAETFYIAAYHHPSSDQILATVFATNPRETLEYFGDGLWLLLFCMITALALALVGTWLAKRSKLTWTHRSRVWVLAVALGTPVAACITAFFSVPAGAQSPLHIVAVEVGALGDSLEAGYPFGIILRVVKYYKAWNAMYASAAAHDGFRFHATRVQIPPKRQIYVLAIGESSRRNHWQLFGYGRDTNPELSQTANLVPITNMITSWPTSITAIPLILTRKPITSAAMSWNEASIQRAMQEAGFETWWISNQMPIGKYDSPVSVYALEAQHYMFLNRATFASAGGYDDVLLRPLTDVIGNSRGDLFIVLHMMGSHLRYDGRYPPSFARFKPIFIDQTTEVVDGERMRNSYDNTVLYTDHVLTQIITILRDSDSVSALFFESDHGETLPTPTCSRGGHGISSRYDFEIPAFFWYSDQYAQTFPDRISAIRSNAAQSTLSADTFETLIDMTNITYPGRDASWSLLGDKWHFHPRIVNSLEQIDFDTAQEGKGCGTLMSPTGK